MVEGSGSAQSRQYNDDGVTAQRLSKVHYATSASPAIDTSIASNMAFASTIASRERAPPRLTTRQLAGIRTVLYSLLRGLPNRGQILKTPKSTIPHASQKTLKTGPLHRSPLPPTSSPHRWRWPVNCGSSGRLRLGCR